MALSDKLRNRVQSELISKFFTSGEIVNGHTVRFLLDTLPPTAPSYTSTTQKPTAMVGFCNIDACITQ